MSDASRCANRLTDASVKMTASTLKSNFLSLGGRSKVSHMAPFQVDCLTTPASWSLGSKICRFPSFSESLSPERLSREAIVGNCREDLYDGLSENDGASSRWSVEGTGRYAPLPIL